MASCKDQMMGYGMALSGRTLAIGSPETVYVGEYDDISKERTYIFDLSAGADLHSSVWTGYPL